MDVSVVELFHATLKIWVSVIGNCLRSHWLEVRNTLTHWYIKVDGEQQQLRIKAVKLTSVMCVDSDVHQRPRCHAQGGDAIHGLYVEGVADVHREVQYCHRCASQAQWPGDEAQVRLAGLALDHTANVGASVAALAEDVVSDVLPASGVMRRHPLEDESRVVDQGDQVPGSRRGSWRER